MPLTAQTALTFLYYSTLHSARRAYAVEKNNTLPETGLYNVIYIYIDIYVRVASRNRTLAHIGRFEKMADEVGVTENRLYWFT